MRIQGNKRKGEGRGGTKAEAIKQREEKNEKDGRKIRKINCEG